MSRYIAVIHGWHVHSNGFTTHELKAKTREEAEKEACWLKDKRERPFDTCACIVLEISESEALTRKLSMRERLAGKLSAQKDL